ncbi:hypothetical protein JXA84_08075 [candidate division WOR-3 bacterium]|nr:hypothetical protein [candidate division WOR-3 bacterium]
MSKKNVLQCPKCGAPLDPEKANGKFRCPFCGTWIDFNNDDRVDISNIPEMKFDFPTIDNQSAKKIVKVSFILFLSIAVLLVGGMVALIKYFTSSVIVGDKKVEKIFEYGSEGTGPGFFQDVRYVITTQNGLVITCEYENGRVQVFDSSMNYLRQWTVGKQAYVQSFSTDGRETVFVISKGDILSYNLENGSFSDSVEIPTISAFTYEALTVLPDGNILVIYDRENLAKLDSDFNLIWNKEKIISSNSDFYPHTCELAVDGEGYIYVFAVTNSSVFKFSPEGKFFTRFGSEGDGPGFLSHATGEPLVIDNQSNIYIEDFDGIEVFNKDGRFLTQLEVERPVYGMTIDMKNNLYTANGKKIIKYRLNPANFSE